MIDLQAHGESFGDQITLGYLEKLDVRAVVEYVKSELPNRKIGIVGWSLGGASALLASPLGVDAMVLEAVYPTIEHAVYDRIDMRIGIGKHIAAPFLLAQLPLRLGISANELMPIDFVEKIDCPLMILAGDKDLHTPIDESQMMLKAANEPKELVVFEGASHVDLLHHDKLLYGSKVLQFLRTNLGPIILSGG
jgi:pimeloyl-ACP methyl ester carboxylesterase